MSNWYCLVLDHVGGFGLLVYYFEIYGLHAFYQVERNVMMSRIILNLQLMLLQVLFFVLEYIMT